MYAKELLLQIHSGHPEIIREIDDSKLISNELKEKLNAVIKEITERFIASK